MNKQKGNNMARRRIVDEVCLLLSSFLQTTRYKLDYTRRRRSDIKKIGFSHAELSNFVAPTPYPS